MRSGGCREGQLPHRKPRRVKANSPERRRARHGRAPGFPCVARSSKDMARERRQSPGHVQPSKGGRACVRACVHVPASPHPHPHWHCPILLVPCPPHSGKRDGRQKTTGAHRVTRVEERGRTVLDLSFVPCLPNVPPNSTLNTCNAVPSPIARRPSPIADHAFAVSEADAGPELSTSSQTP